MKIIRILILVLSLIMLFLAFVIYYEKDILPTRENKQYYNQLAEERYNQMLDKERNKNIEVVE